MEHPSFLIHFDKRIEDKQWLGVGLGRCIDRQWLLGVLMSAVRFVIEG